MKVISAAERRLIAALDRLDHAVEQAARRMAEPPARPQPGAPLPTPAPDAAISPEIAALRDRQAATVEAMQNRLAEAHERLAEAGEQAARLAAANDELALANRRLIEAAGRPDSWDDDGQGATLSALEAEVEALRAARAAEIAQMSGILDALDRMLGIAPRSGGPEDETRIASESPAPDGPDATAPTAGGAGRPPAADAELPEDDAPAIRELSIIRDEDPLPEDEPLAEADTPEEIRFGQGRGQDSEEERR